MSDGMQRGLDTVSVFIEGITDAERGSKADKGKPPISLIPREFLEEVAKAFGYGAEKHGRHNFRKGLRVSRLLDAAFRHISASSNGEDKDPESGLDHLGHAGASLAMALFMLKNRPELDDRYKPE